MFTVPKWYYYVLLCAKTLNYVHSRGVIYGDMKPHNILMFRDRSFKIGDFGISTVIEKGRNTGYTLKGLSLAYA